MVMNTPARFETLLWMASPLMAWAQASAEPAPRTVETAPPEPIGPEGSFVELDQAAA
jgi:hypothetical protein